MTRAAHEADDALVPPADVWIDRGLTVHPSRVDGFGLSCKHRSGLIVDALLGELYGGVTRPRPDAPERYELPDNLESFFAGKRQRSIEQSACCSPAAQASCCEASTKTECCGHATGEGCGCQ